MEERFNYCADCINKGKCAQCYRGSWYERKKDNED